MKIVHIISGLTNGGAEAVLYRLCASDTKSTHIVISLSEEGKYADMLRDAGVELHCLCMSRGIISFLSSLAKLYRLLRNISPDAIQTWMYHSDLVGGLVARLAGVRNIFWGIHSTTLDPDQSPRATILVSKINAKLSYFIPRQVICCAQKSLEVHAELGYAKNKLLVVNNGYDLSQYYIDSEMAKSIKGELSLDDGSLLIGLVGRFDAQKDHRNLIQALAIVKETYPQTKCLLIGPNLNDSNQILGGWIDRHKLRENILLLDQRGDVPAIMNALDIHVLSSAFGEAFPNVLNEAMACGTPCVTTDIGDAALIVGDTGWVVPPKNPEALAQAILLALTEKQTSQKAWKYRQLKARQRVEENFSIETMIRKYHATWKNGVTKY